jgi:hypothetical protein
MNPRDLKASQTVHFTFITVSHGKKVNVNTLRVEEQEADPTVCGVNWDDEQDSNNPSLFCWVRVPSKMMVYLLTRDEKRNPYSNSSQTLTSFCL